MKGWWNGPEIILWLVIVTRSCTFISTAQLPVFITSCWESFQDSNSWKLAWWHGMFNLYPINFDRKSKNLNIRSLFSNNLLLWERKETGETVCPNRGQWNFTEALREFSQNWPKQRAAYFATLLVCVFSRRPHNNLIVEPWTYQGLGDLSKRRTEQSYLTDHPAIDKQFRRKFCWEVFRPPGFYKFSNYT